MFLCEKKIFVPSAIITGSNIFDTLLTSFLYIMNISGKKVVISSLDLLVQIVFSLKSTLRTNYDYYFLCRANVEEYYGKRYRSLVKSMKT